MNHSRTSGASVYELTKVKSISFSAEEPDKPVSVTWSHTPPPEPISPPISRAASERSFGEDERTQASVTGLTTFEYIIDATGRAGIISTKYLKNRHFNASLKNIAVWGYWTNTGVYGVGTHKEGAPWFEALTGELDIQVQLISGAECVSDESGWAWFIPLHDGTTSVGVVMNQKCYNDLKDTPRPHPIRTFDTPTSSMVERYLSNLSFAPGLVKLLTPGGKMIQGSVKSASDYSYSAPSYAGNRYRIIGDAGAFIDPFFSSGVHLALTSALSAAASICASIRGDCSELDAGNWHTRRVATSYTRFQVVVLSAYKQIRAQNVDVLADVDEDNYDRAFSFLRPVIQGASDMGKQLTDAELQRSLDFCVNLFNPTDADEQDKPVQAPKIGKELLDIATPTIDPRFLENALLRGSGDAKTNATSVENTMLLKKINARKVIHTEYNANNMESEPLDGLVMKLEKGRLGLTLVSA
ncbi:hypothetical protein H0H81_009245 [Sphagnurus paluster]|uniref:Uncharacterized protein n=1 Tax=Sphagnurus paluster TaxID=117069 RepID=A0A9P7FS62_9AGAR|nr:hypothetical protein H0H81_009245 [Sphagnurus paluster]